MTEKYALAAENVLSALFFFFFVLLLKWRHLWKNIESNDRCTVPFWVCVEVIVRLLQLSWYTFFCCSLGFMSCHSWDAQDTHIQLNTHLFPHLVLHASSRSSWRILQPPLLLLLISTK